MLNPAPVLFLTHGMSVGGAEMMLLNLLNNFDRSRLTPVVVSLAPPAALEERLDPAVTLVHAPRSWRYDLRPSATVLRTIERERIGTVLTLNMFSYLFVRRALRHHPALRVYLSMHTTRPRTAKELLQTSLYARLLRPRDTVVTVCDSQADYLARLYRIPRSRFRTIYNGVDTRRWCPAPATFDRQAFRNGLDIPPGTPLILQVAHFRAEKRQEDAVRALAALMNASPLRPVLVFVGGGEALLRDRVRAEASRLGVAHAVRFCGPQADPLPWYWAADLCILSSTSETLPVSMLEAMATGLPVVMPDIGGAREAIEEGITGALAAPGRPESLAAAWRRILEDPGQFDPARIAGRTRERFSLDRCVRAYEELLCPEEK